MKEKTYETKYNQKPINLKLIKVDDDTLESTLELKSNIADFRKEIISKIDFLNNEKVDKKLEDEISEHIKRDFIDNYIGDYLKKLGLDIEKVVNFYIEESDIEEDDKYIGVFCKAINIAPEKENKDKVINGYKPELRFYLNEKTIKVLPILEQTGNKNIVDCIEDFVFLQIPPLCRWLFIPFNTHRYDEERYN